LCTAGLSAAGYHGLGRSHILFFNSATHISAFNAQPQNQKVRLALTADAARLTCRRTSIACVHQPKFFHSLTQKKAGYACLFTLQESRLFRA
jgi:hypothetical protein